jgi:phosphoenolpyruvate carboxykinase (ATP)
MYHFISGYTAKVSGTEEGVSEPTATFSSCFGAPFLVRNPTVYARMLATRLQDHAAQAWLVNTGWVGGSPGSPTGKRCPLVYTRAIVDAIHAGSLADLEYEVYPVFNLHVPTSCPGLPSEILHPGQAWKDNAAFEATRMKVARLFQENFASFAEFAGPEVVSAGPSQ